MHDDQRAFLTPLEEITAGVQSLLKSLEVDPGDPEDVLEALGMLQALKRYPGTEEHVARLEKTISSLQAKDVLESLRTLDPALWESDLGRLRAAIQKDMEEPPGTPREPALRHEALRLFRLLDRWRCALSAAWARLPDLGGEFRSHSDALAPCVAAVLREPELFLEIAPWVRAHMRAFRPDAWSQAELAADLDAWCSIADEAGFGLLDPVPATEPSWAETHQAWVPKTEALLAAAVEPDSIPETSAWLYTWQSPDATWEATLDVHSASDLSSDPSVVLDFSSPAGEIWSFSAIRLFGRRWEAVSAPLTFSVRELISWMQNTPVSAPTLEVRVKDRWQTWRMISPVQEENRP